MYPIIAAVIKGIATKIMANKLGGKNKKGFQADTGIDDSNPVEGSASGSLLNQVIQNRLQGGSLSGLARQKTGTAVGNTINSALQPNNMQQLVPPQGPIVDSPVPNPFNQNNQFNLKDRYELYGDIIPPLYG